MTSVTQHVAFWKQGKVRQWPDHMNMCFSLTSGTWLGCGVRTNARQAGCHLRLLKILVAQMFLCPAGQAVAVVWILGKSDHGVFRRPSVRPKHEGG